MLPIRTLALAVFLAAPAHASAQARVEADAAGNYQGAADVLQQLVVDFSRDPLSADPEPYRQLAQLYADGRGVPQDPVAACSLARMAGQATMMVAPKRQNDSDEFIRRHCESLTEEDRLAAELSIGCFALGMPEQTVMLAGRSVRIGRRGIWFADGNKEGWELYGCLQVVAHVRTTSLAPPDDAAPGVGPRHFIEVFSWAAGRKDGRSDYGLRWHVYEVGDKRITFFPAADPLITRSIWPGRGLPDTVEKGLTLDMIRSGQVRWTLDAAPPKRGWFMIGEGGRR